MDAGTIFAVGAMVAAGIAIGLGTIGPGIGQGSSVASALDALARQPEASDSIMRTLFIGLAMIESLTIYSLVIALIILFVNPMQSLIGHH